MVRTWLLFVPGCFLPATAVIEDGSSTGTSDPPVTHPGPGAGAYRVTGEVQATWADGLTATVAIRVGDPDGRPSKARVWVDDTALIDVGSGSYVGSLATWDERFDLRIDGPAGVYEATVYGPILHETTLPPGPWDVDRDVTVSWTPHGASFAAVETDGGGRTELLSDTGSATLSAGTLALGTEHVVVERWDTPDLIAAAPGSSLRVSVTTIDEGVTITDDPDPPTTTTGGPGSLGGELRVDSDWQDEVATAWVLVNDEVSVRLDGFQDREDYELGDLEPGTWPVLAYLDLDGSDGPTSGDPFVEDTVTISAGERTRADLRMDSVW
jgi:hypothetical protein